MLQQIGLEIVREQMVSNDRLLAPVWERWLGIWIGIFNSITRIFIPGSDALTYAGTISVDVTLGRVKTVTTTNAIGNATINLKSGGFAGQDLFFVITNDVTANRTITFGTHLKPSATIVGTTSKTATIHFISDGTSFWEIARTLGL